MCCACYRANVYSSKTPHDLRKPASCHPERAHYVKGQCRECYVRSRESLPALRDRQRLRRYGLTPAAHRSMLAAQNYACAICKEVPLEGDDALHVDHDHVTNEVRGLLCLQCNVGLGAFRDRRELLSVAIDYLAVASQKKGAA